MKTIHLIILLIVIIMFAVVLATFEKPTNLEDISGKVVEEPTHTIDVVEIEKNNMEACCSFTDENDEEKSCYALKNFGCDYCNNVC